MYLNLILLILIANFNVKCQTVASVAPCPSGYNSYCKNSGYCVILFGTTLSCTCPVGFTGFWKGYVIVFF